MVVFVVSWCYAPVAFLCQKGGDGKAKNPIKTITKLWLKLRPKADPQFSVPLRVFPQVLANFLSSFPNRRCGTRFAGAQDVVQEAAFGLLVTVSGFLRWISCSSATKRQEN